MKILFICTSNRDRSPSLEKYFRAVYPQHKYRSAGINKYFCGEKKTHYLIQEDVDWADLIVFAENIHLQVTAKHYGFFARCYSDDKVVAISGDANHPNSSVMPDTPKYLFVLNCGNYLKGALHDDYLTCAEQKLEHLLKQK